MSNDPDIAKASGRGHHAHDDHAAADGHGGGEEHEEGGHGEPWLVSYADLMTLLFGFFVIMYSLAAAKNSDEGDTIKIRKELAVYFGGNYVNPIDKLQSDLDKFLAKSPELMKSMMVSSDPDGMKIVITSAVLFESGKADISADTLPIIKVLVDTIGQKSKDSKIRVEGYTDDNPINKGAYPSNWELSSARASAVLRVFEQAGFNQESLQATGFGASHPMLPNRNELGVPIPENQSRNRRVVIRVIPSDEEATVKPGAAPEEPEAHH